MALYVTLDSQNNNRPYIVTIFDNSNHSTLVLDLNRFPWVQLLKEVDNTNTFTGIIMLRNPDITYRFAASDVVKIGTHTYTNPNVMTVWQDLIKYIFVNRVILSEEEILELISEGITGVSSFNGRTGAVTLLSNDVTTALGYTPFPTPTGSILQYVRGNGTLATFPTTLSSFTNDVGYITASSHDNLTNKTGLISMWTNDVGYLTSSDLGLYYKQGGNSFGALALLGTLDNQALQLMSNSQSALLLDATDTNHSATFWPSASGKVGINTPAGPIFALDVNGQFGATDRGYPTSFNNALGAQFYTVHGSGNWGFSITRAVNDNGGANLALFKTRNANAAIKTSVIASDLIGRLTFQAVAGDNATVGVSGQFSMTVDTVATNYVSGYFHFITTDNSGASAERMRITSSGSVGIGNSAPAYKLDVTGTGRFTTSLEVTGNAGITLGGGIGVLKWTGTDLQFGSIDAGFNTTTFYSAGSIVGRYYSTGNWYIGSSPVDNGNKLTVNGNQLITGILTVGPTSDNKAVMQKIVDGNSNIFRFDNSGDAGGYGGGFVFTTGSNGTIASSIATLRIYNNSNTLPGSVFIGNVTEGGAQSGITSNTFGVLNRLPLASLTSYDGVQLNPGGDRFGSYNTTNGKQFGIFVGSNSSDSFTSFASTITTTGIFIGYQYQPLSNGYGSSIVFSAKDDVSTTVEILRLQGKDGNIGVHVADASARIHILASSGAARTAPIKLTTGTLLTTTEDGALEYGSSHLWYTIGSTRYQLDQQNGIGSFVPGGTTGSILFIDPTNTLAQDNANLFWDNANNRLGIRTNTPSAVVDIITGVSDGSSTVFDSNSIRLRHQDASSYMLMQMGVSNVGIGGNNNGYGYISTAYVGAGNNNPLLLNATGGAVGINTTFGVFFPLTVSNTIGIRATVAAGNNTIGGRLTFAHTPPYSANSAYIAGIYDKSGWPLGEGIIFATVSGADISGVDGIERMRISSDGNILIGSTIDAGFKLDVTGRTLYRYIGGPQIYIDTQSSGGTAMTIGYESGYNFFIRTNNGGQGQVTWDFSGLAAVQQTIGFISSVSYLATAYSVDSLFINPPGKTLWFGDISGTNDQTTTSTNSVTFNRAIDGSFHNYTTDPAIAIFNGAYTSTIGNIYGYKAYWYRNGYIGIGTANTVPNTTNPLRAALTINQGTKTGYQNNAQATLSKVITTGSSTLVAFTPDNGNTVPTYGLIVGSIITANSVTRTVTQVNADSVLVDSAVDWSAGYSFTYRNPYVDIADGTTSYFHIAQSGNVLIGSRTDMTTVKFNVSGSIRSEGAMYVDRVGGNLTNYVAIIARGASEASNFGNPLGNGAVELSTFNTAGMIIGTNTATPIVFGVGNVEYGRFYTNGNFGFGDTAPNYQVSIKSPVTNTGVMAIKNPSGLVTAAVGIWPGGAGFWQIFNNTGTATIQLSGDNTSSSYFNSGNVGIGTNTPGAATKLQVNGLTLITGGITNPIDSTPAGLSLTYETTSNGTGAYISAIQTGVAWEPLFIQSIPGSNGDTIINSDMGYVSIGYKTSQLQYKLEVTDSQAYTIGAVKTQMSVMNRTTGGTSGIAFTNPGSWGVAIWTNPGRGWFEFGTSAGAYHRIFQSAYLFSDVGTLAWSSESNFATDGVGAMDTAINRNAAGVLEINNGTPGTYRDLITRNLLSTNKIGVGLLSPTYPLHIRGPLNKTNNQIVALLESNDTSNSLGLYIRVAGDATSSNNAISFQSEEAGISYRPIALNPIAGPVGIGLSVPTFRFHAVQSTAALQFGSGGDDNTPTLSIVRTGSSGQTLLNIGQTGVGFISDSSGELRMIAPSTWFPTFYSNNSERMRIALSGNILIGTATDASTGILQVVGNIATSGASAGVTVLDRSGSGSGMILYTSGGSFSLFSSISGTDMFKINLTNGLANFVSSGSSANLVVGSSSNNGSRLQVYGNVYVANEINLASGGYIVNNSLLTYMSNGGGSSGYIGFGFTNTATPTTTDTVFNIYQGRNVAPGNLFNFQHSLSNNTGNSTAYAIINITTEINQTASSNGIVRGIYYNPTLTSVLGEHRAIETVSGDVIFGSTSGKIQLGSRTLASESTYDPHVLIGNSGTNLRALISGQVNVSLMLKDYSQATDLKTWELYTSLSNFSIGRLNDGFSSRSIVLFIPGSSNNVLIGSTTDNGSKFQVAGNATFSGTIASNGIKLNYVTKTSTYAIADMDYTVDCTTGSFTVTLPDASTRLGQIYNVINSGSGTITVATTSSQTIGNTSSDPTSINVNPGSNMQVQSTGSNWRIL